MKSISDDIIVGLKQGNESAILIVFSAYKYYAKGYYTGKYGTKFGLHHWEDIVQECFIALKKHLYSENAENKPDTRGLKSTWCLSGV